MEENLRCELRTGSDCCCRYLLSPLREEIRVTIQIKGSTPQTSKLDGPLNRNTPLNASLGFAYTRLASQFGNRTDANSSTYESQ